MTTEREADLAAAEAAERIAEAAADGPEQGFRAVVAEAARLLGGVPTSLQQFEHDGSNMVVVSADGAEVAPGSILSIGDDGLSAEILRTGRSRTIVRTSGPRDGNRPGVVDDPNIVVVGAPVVVAGQLWGTLTAMSANETLGPDAEHRLTKLAALAGGAIWGMQARLEARDLAAGQAALLGVAKMVARGATDEELFDAVARGASSLLGDEATTLVRMDGERSFTILATCRGPAAVGTHVVIPDDDKGSIATMLRTGRPARLDDYGKQPDTLTLYGRDWGIGSAVTVPIVVDNRIWGALGTLTTGRRLPARTEARLQQFAEIVAAALANSQARADLQRSVDEQSALRRVAELVARGVEPEEVFTAVTAEVSASLDGGPTALARFDDDGHGVVVAGTNQPTAIGYRFLLEPGSGGGYVRETGRPYRRLSYAGSALEAPAREHNIGAVVHVPVIVEGRVWGMSAYSTSGEPPPEGTEESLFKYAALTAAAVANVEYRARLKASRARVVATADETRRRLQRDVHDGAQQWLVQTVLSLRMGRDAARRGVSTAELIDEALRSAERAVTELRDLVRGIMPTSLARGGLRAGLESLIADLPTRVELEVLVPKLEPETEVSAYFVVAEALTNVVKHARATSAVVTVTSTDDTVRIEVGDDGVGGADPGRGSGLTGLFDRVEALNGTLVITSRAGVGTTLVATLPLSTAGPQGG